ncbi:hypothetical protein F4554_005551 [Actinopolymorpha rutila]|uniref:Uncharacterized protein n=1 Tax=Actinopolymorpha rutila TaxID=446787 RepID=A0A852ZL21_9ACTN|nr:hypothetical protein [Actinopolymorpha rutila]
MNVRRTWNGSPGRLLVAYVLLEWILLGTREAAMGGHVWGMISAAIFRTWFAWLVWHRSRGAWVGLLVLHALPLVIILPIVTALLHIGGASISGPIGPPMTPAEMAVIALVLLRPIAQVVLLLSPAVQTHIGLRQARDSTPRMRFLDDPPPRHTN